MSDMIPIQSLAWPRAYSDAEVAEPPNDGQVYYNVSDREYKVWYNNMWNSMSTGVPRVTPPIPGGWAPSTEWPNIANIVNSNTLPWQLHLRVNIGANGTGAPQPAGWTEDFPLITSPYGTTISVIPSPINLTATSDPAPLGVYQSYMMAATPGTLNLNFLNLNFQMGYTYTARLHTIATGTDPNQQRFNVTVNGTTQLTAFSPVAQGMLNPNYSAGDLNAIAVDLPPVTASATGVISLIITDSGGTTGLPLICAAEVICNSPTYNVPKVVVGGSYIADVGSRLVVGTTNDSPVGGAGQVAYDNYFSDGNAILISDYIGPQTWWGYNIDPTFDYVPVNDVNGRVHMISTQYFTYGYDLYPIDAAAMYHYFNNNVRTITTNNSVNIRAFVAGQFGGATSGIHLLMGSGFLNCFTLARYDIQGFNNVFVSGSGGFQNCYALCFLNQTPAIGLFYLQGIGAVFINAFAIQDFLVKSTSFSFKMLYANDPTAVFTQTYLTTFTVPPGWIPIGIAGGNQAGSIDLSSAPNLSINSLATICNNAGFVTPGSLSGDPAIIFGATNKAKVPQTLLDLLISKGFIHD